MTGLFAAFMRHFNPRSLTGATDSCFISWYNNINFNPRSLTGATFCSLLLVMTPWIFQSTLPHGSD